MTPKQKLEEACVPIVEPLANGYSLYTALLDMSEIERARLARVLIEDISWLREEHFALGQHIRRHTRKGESKKSDE